MKDEVQEHVIDKLKSQPTASLFRRQFAVSRTLQRARLHSTAAGYYEVYLNGKKVSDRLMDPGQTDYDERILYNTGRSNERCRQGGQTPLPYTWEVAGTTRKSHSLNRTRICQYGQPGFIAQLELYYDRWIERVHKDGQRVAKPPITDMKEGLFSGEFYDADKGCP